MHGRFASTRALLSEVMGPDFADLVGKNHLARAYRRGEIIFQQGDFVEDCFFVIDGSVKIYRERTDGEHVVVSVFSEGEIYFDPAMFLGDSSHVSAEAVSPSRIIRISAKFLRRVLEQRPLLTFEILAAISDQYIQLIEQIEQLKAQSVTQRIADFLLKMLKTSSGFAQLVLPYEKALIANYLGARPESFSRALVRMREIGVHVRQNNVQIKDIGRLIEHACWSEPQHGARNDERRLVEQPEALRRVSASVSSNRRPAHQSPSGAGNERFNRLSTTETNALAGLAKGQTNEILALELGASKQKIETIRASILSKTGAESRSEIVRAYSSDDGVRLAGATGEAGQRSFNAALVAEWRKAIHSGSPISLLLVKIGQIEHFNARQPARQDDVLTAVSGAMSEVEEGRRKLIARYGEDSFAVALPETGQDAARKLAKKIRRSIETSAIIHAPNSDSQRLAPSVGMATITPTRADRVEKIVCFADIALHRARTSSGSRVHAFHDGPSCSKAKRSPSGGITIPIIKSSHCAECRRDAPRA